MILHFTAWRQIYQNDPLKIMADQGIQITDELKKLVQGQEVGQALAEGSEVRTH